MKLLSRHIIGQSYIDLLFIICIIGYNDLETFILFSSIFLLSVACHLFVNIRCQL